MQLVNGGFAGLFLFESEDMSAEEKLMEAKDSVARSWEPRGHFHHVGFVVASIQQTVQGFRESLDAEWDGVIVHDANQEVRVTFLQSKEPADPLFELVEPASEDSPVMSFANKGGGIHHVCYIVGSLEAQLDRCRSQRMLVVRPPLPAAALPGPGRD